MDFAADALFDGRKLRILTVVDLLTRECLANTTGSSSNQSEKLSDSVQRDLQLIADLLYEVIFVGNCLP